MDGGQPFCAGSKPVIPVSGGMPAISHAKIALLGAIFPIAKDKYPVPVQQVIGKKQGAGPPLLQRVLDF